MYVLGNMLILGHVDVSLLLHQQHRNEICSIFRALHYIYKYGFKILNEEYSIPLNTLSNTFDNFQSKLNFVQRLARISMRFAAI